MELHFKDSSTLEDRCKIAMFIAEKRGDIKRQRKSIIILGSVLVVGFLIDLILYLWSKTAVPVWFVLIAMLGLGLLLCNKPFTLWYYKRYYRRYYMRLFKNFNIPVDVTNNNKIDDKSITIEQDGAIISFLHSDFIKAYGYDIFHVLEYNNMKYIFIKQNSVTNEEYTAILDAIHQTNSAE